MATRAQEALDPHLLPAAACPEATALPPSLRAPRAASDEAEALTMLDERLAASLSEVRRLIGAVEGAARHEAEQARTAAARGRAIAADVAERLTAEADQAAAEAEANIGPRRV